MGVSSPTGFAKDGLTFLRCTLSNVSSNCLRVIGGIILITLVEKEDENEVEKEVENEDENEETVWVFRLPRVLQKTILFFSVVHCQMCPKITYIIGCIITPVENEDENVVENRVENDDENENEETVWVFLLPRVLQKTVLGSRVNIGPH